MSRSALLVERTQQMLEHNPAPILLFLPDLTLLYANPAHERMTGRALREIAGIKMFDAFPANPGSSGENALEAVAASVSRVILRQSADEVVEQKHDIASLTGEYVEHFWSMTHWPVLEGGEVVAILQRSEDVTAHVRQRRLTETVQRAAERGLGLSFFSYDPETDKFERSQAIDAMFGFEDGEAGVFATAFFARIHGDDLPSVHAEVQRSLNEGPGAAAAFDYRVILPQTREQRYIRVRAGVQRDASDGKVKLYGAFVDTTDVENDRIMLAEMSARNQALVIESNHRIKNSLAIASAILSQQMRATDNELVHEALQSAATRIIAIANVHGELFDDSGIRQVDGGNLIERFVNSFGKTIGSDEKCCRFNVRADHLLLPSDHAVTLTLTLNELLTNAVKYGLSGGEICTIDVELKHEGDLAVLLVSNSVATDRELSIASEGVGSRLVSAFAQQLGAEMTLQNADGLYAVRFAFPIAPIPGED